MLIQIIQTQWLSDPYFLLAGNENYDISFEQLSYRIIFVIIFSWSECTCLNSTK